MANDLNLVRQNVLAADGSSFYSDDIPDIGDPESRPTTTSIIIIIIVIIIVAVAPNSCVTNELHYPEAIPSTPRFLKEKRIGLRMQGYYNASYPDPLSTFVARLRRSGEGEEEQDAYRNHQVPF